jgi:menaquinone-specific isochorismate synthase
VTADSRSLRYEVSAAEAPADWAGVLRLLGDEPRFYLEEPARGVVIAGIGAVADFRGSGAHRFEEISRVVRECFAALGAKPGDPGPIAVGGFAFSGSPSPAEFWRGFPPAWMFVPRLMWMHRGGRCTMIRVWRTGEEAAADRLLARVAAARRDFPRIDFTLASASATARRIWRERVERAKLAIVRGDLEKVVLSRSLTIESRNPIDAAQIVDAARSARPQCFNFCVGSGPVSFAGSTPELLVRVENGRAISGALGGSAPRGGNPAEDRALGEALLKSAKEREEHQIVVRAVRETLERVAAPLDVPDMPRLMLLPEAQHLFTSIEGRLREPLSAIELAGLLHPTPAVCGVPLETAREIIEREEPDRGWYTGAIGWMDARGEGEFAVALRAGLIQGNRMRLWAGAGIVAGSDPDAEFDETEGKFTALLRNAAVGTAA